ncbi:MAG: leucyl aminopeptidase family protein [Candidatus Sumerlaeia bacterium]|nr:leucyl aminopeptidase family protein [Candidatus Sumerlaeia bacterium]
MKSPVRVVLKSPAAVRAGALVVLLREGGLPPLGDSPVLMKHGRAFERAVRAGDSKAEWFCTLAPELGVATHHVLFESDSFGSWLPGDDRLKAAAARAVATCRQHGIADVAFACEGDDEGAMATAIAEGALLGDFRDQRFKSSAETRKPLTLRLVVPGDPRARIARRVDDTLAVCAAVNWTRELVNAPSNEMTPADLAHAARRLARGKRVTATILDARRIRQAGYTLLDAVGGASIHPPRLIVLRYRPAKRPRLREHIVLLGKGICYDTGGLSLKTTTSMVSMSGDMAGGAAVLGAFRAAVELDLPVHLTAIVPAAMNDVDAHAYKPGDILRSKAGRTVCIENTDAEGRLVLADGLFRAGEEKADVVIDLATLTGSVREALGPARAALFTDDEALAASLAHAGDETGDRLWRLPLVREYETGLTHPLADLSNISTSIKGAGAIHGANFLKAFVPEGVRWAHLDIAAVSGRDADTPLMARGATGWGVRLLVAALRRWAEQGRVE